MVIRSAPKMDGSKTFEVIKPSVVFGVSEEKLGDDGVLFLRLSDGRGWVFDRKPGVGTMCVRALLWRYHCGDQTPLVIRAGSNIDGARTQHTLAPGEVFCAAREQMGLDGVLYLELADGRGWAFDKKPGVGVMCARFQSPSQVLDAAADGFSVWCYDAGDGKPIVLRKEPKLDGMRSSEMMQPGEVFRVRRELRGDDGVLFLELSDGRGWLFDRKPDSGRMCVKHERVILHIYDVPSEEALQRINGIARALGTGAFHAGVEVFGQEWSFGSSGEGDDHEDATGVFSCPPRGCDGHSYRESLPMGHTSLTEEEIRQLIARLTKEWKAKDYSLLRRNCCHFSNLFLAEMGVDELPTWVRNLSTAGAALNDAAKAFDERRRQVVTRGKLTRGTDPTEGFQFGDLTIGIAATMGAHVTDLVKGNELVRRVSHTVTASVEEVRQNLTMSCDGN